MRKALTLICLVFSVSVSFSQINISSFPAVNDTVLYKSIFTNIPFSSFDHTGQNQVWDFTSFFSYQSAVDTLFFRPVSYYAESINFPGAGLVAEMDSGQGIELFNAGTFLKQENNKIVSLGKIEEINDNALSVPIVYTSSLDFFSFPLNIGNSFRDTTTGTIRLLGALVGIPADSAMMRRTIYRHDTIDATGELRLPYHTYTNTFRNKLTDHYVDSVFTYTTGSGWTFFHTELKQNNYVFWHRPDQFLLSWMTVDNDTVTSFHVPKPPPFSLKLEFNNLPSQIIEGVEAQTFEVRALHKSDNSLATEFNDTILLLFNPLTSFTGQFFQLAQNGVATFSDITFLTPGDFEMTAYTRIDTLDRDSVAIHVTAGPDHIEINNLQSALEGQTLPAFQVMMYNTSGQTDLLYQDTIHLGKLDGRGKLSGTTVKPAVNGVATFDDISFNFADQYNLIAWSENSSGVIGTLPYLDSSYLTINSNPDLHWIPYLTDTLSEYVDRAQYFVWTGNADGFLSGTSRTWYDEIGQHFDFSKKGMLTQVVFYMSDIYTVNNILNDTYKVKIYNSGIDVQQPPPTFTRIVSDSLCLELLGEQSFSVSDLHTSDYYIRTPSVVNFDIPVEVYSDFIVSLEVNNQTSDDTIIMWTSIIGDGAGEHRTLRHVIENYSGFNSGWVHDHDWRPQYDVDFMIMPVLEIDTADIVTGIPANGSNQVNIYPNPTRNNIVIETQITKGTYQLRDIAGKIVLEGVVNAPKFTLDISSLKSGIYFISVSDNEKQFKAKVVRE